MADDELYAELFIENESLHKRIAELENELVKWVQFWRDKDNLALRARIEELEKLLDYKRHLETNND